MNPERQQAIDYLRAPNHGLWHWAENGAVVVMQDGTTVAFREEIIQILEWLAPNGLPSFGAIVFLLAGLKGKVPAVSDIVADSDITAQANPGERTSVLVSARMQLRAQLSGALAQLAKLSQLPAELRTDLKAKCVLAEAVFEPARAERHVQAHAVLQGIREPLSDAELTEEVRQGLTGAYIRQIHLVAEGLKPHTPESLALRLPTGLDSLPTEADALLPPAERARKLIEELSRDSDFGALARAARELMAAVRLPRRLGEREELAIGGVADITNRGPLDRLLLSELAHDDLTLAVRVALNEALYLRREPPMREPPGTLAILLDSGVRLWGLPRVFAAAVALALIARDKQHSEVLAWRARGKELLPIDLFSRRGITDHLSALETAAHPGSTLPAFARAVTPREQNQTVLITHADTLLDPDFRRALAEQPDAPGFVAAVDRNGRFELHALPLARRPAVCEADLDLATIFEDKPKSLSVKPELDASLPAIFGVHPFPFLQPLAGKIDQWVKAGNFTYAMLNDRRLVQFGDSQFGGRELAWDLPAGRTIWMEVVEDTIHAVKLGASQRPTRLLTQPLIGGPVRSVDLVAGSDLLAVHREGEVLLVIRTHDVRAYALSDGRMLGRVLNPLHWIHGRFFRGENNFHFVTWDGEVVKFETVMLPNAYSLSTVVTIFDRAGHEGPWLLTRDCKVISTATDQAFKLLQLVKFPIVLNGTQLSKDGNQLFIPTAPKPGNTLPAGCLISLNDTSPEASANCGSGAKYLFDRQPTLPSWNIYRIVDSVARLPDGLAFRGRKNRWRKISLATPSAIRITEMSAQTIELSSLGIAPSEIVELGEARPTNRGCLLQSGTWQNGSKVFVDSRGLLHLKSPDPDMPEVSLMLSHTEVAGWTSDGYVCGPRFFFDEPRTSEPEKVFERVQQFLRTL